MRLVLLLAVLYSASILHTSRAQSGLQCLRCYSLVCGANSTQLTALFDIDVVIGVGQNLMSCCDCFENLATGNCRDNITSTVSALDQLFVQSLSVAQCCANVSEIITTESYQLEVYQSPANGIEACSEQGNMCFHLQDLSRIDTVDLLGSGSYIADHLEFSLQDCIRSISFRPSVRIDSANNGLEFMLYKKYQNQGVFNSILYELVESFSVELSQEADSDIAIATPLNNVCFNAGDTLGFYIPADSTFSLLGWLGNSDTLVHNVTRAAPVGECSQLVNFTEVLPPGSFGTQFDPLISVTFGPMSVTPSLTDPPSTAPPTEQNTQPTPVLPEYAIIAIGAGGGLCLLLVLLICSIMVCFCVKRRLNSRTVFISYQGDTPQRMNTSRRIQEMNSTDDVITVENPGLIDHHDYELPPEQKHFYFELEQNRVPSSRSVDSVQAGRLNSTGQQVPSRGQLEATVYNDPTEFMGTPPTVRVSMAQNPMYRLGEPDMGEEMDFGQPAVHYDVPTALIRSEGQDHPLPPIYHELVDPEERRAHTSSCDNVYSETAFGPQDGARSRDSVASSKRSDRSPSIETTLSAYTQSTVSDAPLLLQQHHYYELEAQGKSPKPRRSSQQSPTLIKLSTDDLSLKSNSLERSSHRVFEPGIYVPGGEERLKLSIISSESEEYNTWKKSSHKASKQSRQFFEETTTFWQPETKEEDIYNQLSERKFREILRDQIIFSSHLGVGQFGSVSKATWTNLQGGTKKVAVKTLKPTMKKDAKIAFLQEAAIMGQFCHSNVVQLYGVVTVGEPIMIVMELMALGDLDNYLYNNYRPGEMAPPHVKTLLSFSRQVACGMKYLARKNFVHRDLAARNVLVTETLVCKIGDFGMSRNLHDTNYYASRGGTVPIKWTAPEGLNYKKFSTASDVYSYGMVLYEIWSLGLKPLAHLNIRNVSQFVTEGKCQHPPPGCPRKIYEIMVECWSPEQSDRPTFSAIFEILNSSDGSLLSWSQEDQGALSNLAMQLGAPLAEGRGMYVDLQTRNLVEEDNPVYLGTDV